MAKKRTSLKLPRKFAYRKQGGKCFYCGLPIWIDSPRAFAKKLRISIKQAKLLKCTGEHLDPHSAGGTTSRANIVASCWYCNSHRHRPKNVLSPSRFKIYVQNRLRKGKWHLVTVAHVVYTNDQHKKDGMSK